MAPRMAAFRKGAPALERFARHHDALRMGNVVYATPSTLHHRQLSSSARRSLPSPTFGSLASSISGPQSPSSYFARPALPANTVIRFVPQQTAWVVERMGKFSRILPPGLAILIPFLDRIAYVKSLKESALEIPSQSAITSDNVALEIDGVLYTRVTDAYKASYGVEDAEYAISQLAQTTMRSEIGKMTLDQTLRERTKLNTEITASINEAAQAWGVVCLRYEIRDIHPPENVVAAMHRQVTAERSKRAEILESEGQRQSAVNIAEGRKQSAILASEAVMYEQVNKAEGEAEAIRLRARAQAEAIDAVAQAIARGDHSAQGALSYSVAEKYVDAFRQFAKEGTAVVVPGNMGDLSGMIASAMAVYGKVTDTNAQAQAKKALGIDGSSSSSDAASDDVSSRSMSKQEMADQVLEGFEETRRSN